MKVNSLKKMFGPCVLSRELEKQLKPFGIELYDTELKNTSFKFRARRTFNKKYYGGGTKWGECIARNGFGQIITWLKPKNAKHLHWEEWALINDLINNICDKYNLGGSCKSWFDGELQYIRKDGQKIWDDGLYYTEIEELKRIASPHLTYYEKHDRPQA